MEWVIVIISIIILLIVIVKIYKFMAKIANKTDKALIPIFNDIRKNMEEYQKKVLKENAIKREKLQKEIDELGRIVTNDELRALLENKKIKERDN